MTDYVLALTFDLRQVTQALQYQFCTRDDGVVCEKLETGTLAGSFNFNEGDTLELQVTGLSALVGEDGDVLKNISVNDCTLLSIAAQMDMPLSMFDPENASIYKKGKKWYPAAPAVHEDDKVNNIKRLRQVTKQPLDIVAAKGQWEISGYLSIQLTTAGGDSFSRLYFFDPEGSTGLWP